MLAFNVLLMIMLLEVDSVFPFRGVEKTDDEPADGSEKAPSQGPTETEVGPRLRRRGFWRRGFGLRYLSDD